MKRIGFSSAAVLWCFSAICAPACARPFTPADDVELALFEYAGYGAPGGVIKYSPNARYFAVVTERGRLDLNSPEDTIWVFRIEDVEGFMRHPDAAHALTPVALAMLATDKDGPVIQHVR